MPLKRFYQKQKMTKITFPVSVQVFCKLFWNISSNAVTALLIHFRTVLHFIKKPVIFNALRGGTQKLSHSLLSIGDNLCDYGGKRVET